MNWIQNLDIEKVTGMVNKVKAAVLQYGEYEAKVREATNNDPWGASSTLMQEIAAATNSYQGFQEVMDTIYKRFLEKDRNWRQCYKALQLLEYLIKNGSERVVDNAREHVYDIRALNRFHYIDEKHKDQGVNIRQRAKEITELLADSERIKEERKKARENRAKYAGVSSDQYRGGGSFRPQSFGSDSLGGYQNSYGNESGSSFQTYDSTPNTKHEPTVKAVQSSVAPPAQTAKVTPPVKELSLLDFATEMASSSNALKSFNIGNDDDDGFSDFVSAPAAGEGASTGAPNAFSNLSFSPAVSAPLVKNSLNSSWQQQVSVQPSATDKVGSSADPFASLVNLDPKSLSNSGAKPEKTLNSISTSGPTVSAGISDWPALNSTQYESSRPNATGAVNNTDDLLL